MILLHTANSLTKLPANSAPADCTFSIVAKTYSGVAAEFPGLLDDSKS